tara:strand:- start:2763 stop:3575 length:813 start_codon:yes stop_codon:yes gene_type:complete
MPEAALVLQEADKLRLGLFGHSKADGVGDKAILTQAYVYGYSFSNNGFNNLQNAIGRPLNKIETLGKHFFLIFNDATTVIHAHHGMKGHWSFGTMDEKLVNPSHVHFRLDFTLVDGSTRSVWYVNERFGKFEILNGYGYINVKGKLKGGFIGDYQLTYETFLSNWNKLRGVTKLRAALMDQDRLCSGVGNYLLAEILYALKYNPEVTLARLKGHEKAVYDTCKLVIEEFYLKTRLKVVYGRNTSPLGNAVETYKASGRTMWWVPVEQTYL